jgi:hypothetical protein
LPQAVVHVVTVLHIVTCVDEDRVHEREINDGLEVVAFPLWLRERCAGMAEGGGPEVSELIALSRGPSRRICSFRSMTSYGSHYRVEGDAHGENHVTFDCGVAELEARSDDGNCSSQGGIVHIKRVGTLKDILVVDYMTLNIVVMVVSWVAKHTEREPRLRRDSHGFWTINLDALPRCSDEPYILPFRASQVRRFAVVHSYIWLAQPDV